MRSEFISNLFKSNDPVVVTPFGGYASNHLIHAVARVLEDEGITHTEEDNLIKNIFNTYKRFETDEIENAHVKVTFDEHQWNFHSDKEGYITIDKDINISHNTSKETQWIPIKHELMVNDVMAYSSTSEIMYPAGNVDYGIISDMDDTVIDTGLSSTFKYKVIVNTFFTHSSKRLPLEGALDFYNLLHAGPNGQSKNPFFYLSNSPWNLYEYLTSFLEAYGFPKGVLLLRDIGFENKKKSSFLERNKFLRITHILTTYAHLNFVLIGDAADLDHDIYIAIARRFPKRISAIYIRTVKDKKKMRVVKQLIEQTTDVDVILVETTKKAIAHARDKGLIP